MHAPYKRNSMKQNPFKKELSSLRNLFIACFFLTIFLTYFLLEVFLNHLTLFPLSLIIKCQKIKIKIDSFIKEGRLSFSPNVFSHYRTSLARTSLGGRLTSCSVNTFDIDAPIEGEDIWNCFWLWLAET